MKYVTKILAVAGCLSMTVGMGNTTMLEMQNTFNSTINNSKFDGLENVTKDLDKLSKTQKIDKKSKTLIEKLLLEYKKTNTENDNKQNNISVQNAAKAGGWNVTPFALLQKVAWGGWLAFNKVLDLRKNFIFEDAPKIVQVVAALRGGAGAVNGGVACVDMVLDVVRFLGGKVGAAVICKDVAWFVGVGVCAALLHKCVDGGKAEGLEFAINGVKIVEDNLGHDFVKMNGIDAFVPGIGNVQMMVGDAVVGVAAKCAEKLGIKDKIVNAGKYVYEGAINGGKKLYNKIGSWFGWNAKSVEQAK